MSKTGLWATAGACLIAGVMVAPPPVFQSSLRIDQAATSVQWAPPAAVAPPAPAVPVDLAPVPIPPRPERDRPEATQLTSTESTDQQSGQPGVARRVREATRSAGSGQSSSSGGGTNGGGGATDNGANPDSNAGGNPDPGAGTPSEDRTPGAESAGPACAPAADSKAAQGVSKASECRRP